MYKSEEKTVEVHSLPENSSPQRSDDTGGDNAVRLLDKNLKCHRCNEEADSRGQLLLTHLEQREGASTSEDAGTCSRFGDALVLTPSRLILR